MNSFLRPWRSVSQPKNRAPEHAPATYRAAARPVIWAELMSRPLPSSAMRPATLPTIVTSRPSRIQTVPRPITIIQCQRDQGSRSRRAGTAVVTVPVEAGIEPDDDACAVMAPSPSSERLTCARRRRKHARGAGGYAPRMRETV
ncbi:hypothetical protein RKD32_002761 [Streptomyces sp. SAI-195]